MNTVQLDGKRITLIKGDCLEVMPKLKDGIVDMVLADLPYGTTRNKWDSIIPLDKLWSNYKRIRKPSTAIVLTSSMPFTLTLGVSNIDELRYEWIWEKQKGSDPLNANRKPLKSHENILVFYSALPIYNPQFEDGIPYARSSSRRVKSTNFGNSKDTYADNTDGKRYPKTVIKFSNESMNTKTNYHPTQKPVALMEYFIKTYTNENDLVLDNTMGSGTTGVACINTNRRFIGIEQDEKYFQICIDRCTEALNNKLVEV